MVGALSLAVMLLGLVTAALWWDFILKKKDIDRIEAKMSEVTSRLNAMEQEKDKIAGELDRVIAAEMQKNGKFVL
jgi:hypothetical protein